jgi:hypothetical protein
MRIYLKLLLALSVLSGCDYGERLIDPEISQLGYTMVDLYMGDNQQVDNRIKVALSDGKITESEYKEIEIFAHPDRRTSKDKLLDQFKDAEKE